ncbi:hypothetical protein SPRG_01371 [Saprolegnia parasitica CBS 223.65]|uniref:Uncharacterized protein n=1 Tax=Saprolegnia parasitica (strain CBS 223.65) TaxID=695850 RepID=A0A067D518_SAPPC|nr:hypothetical protein SPRG_01371 [Saprolegnia parasitica CBS 223.65]KDO34097.1 hypothetical protein SPRG_01371 [Saprolegnia parasitica CBS 223.65]|eukprot:XP_012194980.1 hypothetical protein SPRG_01371 [Saprolegnia parasitica CBS 223.65]
MSSAPTTHGMPRQAVVTAPPIPDKGKRKAAPERKPAPLSRTPKPTPMPTQREPAPLILDKGKRKAAPERKPAWWEDAPTESEDDDDEDLDERLGGNTKRARRDEAPGSTSHRFTKEARALRTKHDSRGSGEPMHEKPRNLDTGRKGNLAVRPKLVYKESFTLGVGVGLFAEESVSAGEVVALPFEAQPVDRVTPGHPATRSTERATKNAAQTVLASSDVSVATGPIASAAVPTKQAAKRRLKDAEQRRKQGAPMIEVRESFTDVGTYFKVKGDQTKFLVDEWLVHMLDADAGLTELPTTTSDALIVVLQALYELDELAQVVADSDLSAHILELWETLHQESRGNVTNTQLDTTTSFPNLVLARGGAHAHFAALVKKGKYHEPIKVAFSGTRDVARLAMATVVSNVGVEVFETPIGTDDTGHGPVHVVADAPLFSAILRKAADAGLLQDLPRRIQAALMRSDVVLPDVNLWTGGIAQVQHLAYTPFRTGRRAITTSEVEAYEAALGAKKTRFNWY